MDKPYLALIENYTLCIYKSDTKYFWSRIHRITGEMIHCQDKQIYYTNFQSAYTYGVKACLKKG